MEYLWQYAGPVGLIASLVFGWWFGAFNWKVWFHHRQYPRSARLLFPYSVRRELLGSDFSPNLLCHTIRRAESLKNDLLFTLDFEHQERARNEYCVIMSMFWPVKLAWNTLLFTLYLVLDSVR